MRRRTLLTHGLAEILNSNLALLDGRIMKRQTLSIQNSTESKSKIARLEAIIDENTLEINNLKEDKNNCMIEARNLKKSVEEQETEIKTLKEKKTNDDNKKNADFAKLEETVMDKDKEIEGLKDKVEFYTRIKDDMQDKPN